jgi:ABC-type glycerol-3-phosphate transport system substrate-binding protein
VTSPGLEPHKETSQPRHQAQRPHGCSRSKEGVKLRQRVTTDIATKGGQFDVMTIGMYETPIWGKKGWLNELKTDAAYDVDDLLPAMRNGLSVDGKLYAAPFYGESSMLMYRKDLADKAGIRFAERPTWDQIVRDAAAKIHDPPRTACTASACAASRAGATTWPS